MPIDKYALRDKSLADMMDALDGMEAGSIMDRKMKAQEGGSPEAKKLNEAFPGDSLRDAVGTHDEVNDPVEDEAEDKKNPVVR